MIGTYRLKSPQCLRIKHVLQFFISKIVSEKICLKKKPEILLFGRIPPSLIIGSLFDVMSIKDQDGQVHNIFSFSNISQSLKCKLR